MLQISAKGIRNRNAGGLVVPPFIGRRRWPRLESAVISCGEYHFAYPQTVVRLAREESL
jgi:hypothetical protein